LIFVVVKKKNVPNKALEDLLLQTTKGADHDSHATTSLVLLHDMRLTGEKRVLYDTVQYYHSKVRVVHSSS
jgi:hypothetical protein